MTWEELKEEARKIGAAVYNPLDEDIIDRIDFKDAHFFDDGTVSMTTNDSGIHLLVRIATHRTPEQMLAIMKALQ